MSILDELANQQGHPISLWEDHGPEFTGKRLDLSPLFGKATLDFSHPRELTDNAPIESFNVSLHKEHRNLNRSLCLDELWGKLEQWCEASNQDRPHNISGHPAPSEFAAAQVRVTPPNDRPKLP